MTGLYRRNAATRGGNDASYTLRPPGRPPGRTPSTAREFPPAEPSPSASATGSMSLLNHQPVTVMVRPLTDILTFCDHVATLRTVARSSRTPPRQADRSLPA